MTISAAQRKNRFASLGGSDAAPAAGLSRYKTQLELWQEKLGMVEPVDLSNNENVHFGNVLEDVIAQEYARRTGVKVRRVNTTLVHPEYEYLTGHMDRDIVGVEEGLECKSADARMIKEWGEEGTDEIPQEHLMQCYHYLAIKPRYRAWNVALLIGGNRFMKFRIERDDTLIKGLVERERDFWNAVQTRNPPDPVDLDDCFRMWPQDNGLSIAATSEIERQLLRVRRRKYWMKLLETAVDADELEVKKFMGEATRLVDGGGKQLCTWKAQSANRIDIGRLREELPDIAAKFNQEQQSRVFRPGKYK